MRPIVPLGGERDNDFPGRVVSEAGPYPVPLDREQPADIMPVFLLLLGSGRDDLTTRSIRPGCLLMLLVVALSGVVFHAYGGSLHHPFVRDDAVHLEQEPHWTGRAGEFVQAWCEPFWYRSPESGLYRPLTTVTIQAGIGPEGARPEPLRAVNLGLQVLVALLLALVLRSAGVAAGIWFLASLLLAAHPLFSEAVLEIVSRSESQAAAGVLVALWATRWRQGWAIAGLAWFLALASKESAAGALPALLVGAGLRRAGTGCRLSRLGGALALAALLYVALRLQALGSLVGLSPESISPLDNPLVLHDGVERFWTALSLLPRYLGRMLWPGSLSADYSLAAVPVLASVAEPLVIVGGLVVLILGAWFLLAVRAGAWLEVCGLLLAAGSYLPVSQLLVPVGTIMAERVFYLPGVGLILAAAGCAHRLGKNGGRGRWVAGAIACVAIVVLAQRAHQRTRDWRSELELYTAALDSQPASARAHCTVAHHLREAGRLAEAEAHLREALEIYPDYIKAHSQLALVLVNRRDLEGALEQFRRAASYPQSSPADHYNYCQALLRVDPSPAHLDEAERRLRVLIESGQGDPSSRALLQEVVRRRRG